MKSRLLIALACSAALLGAGGQSASAYPPSPRTVSASPSVGGPAFAITVTADCSPGEIVTFKLEAETAEIECGRSRASALVGAPEGLGGSASSELSAPDLPGDYRGTATGSASGGLGSFTITVIELVEAGYLANGTFSEPGGSFRWVPIAVIATMALAVALVQFLKWGPHQRLRRS